MLDSIYWTHLLQRSKQENLFSTMQTTQLCRNLSDTSAGTANSRSGESPCKGCKAGPGELHAILHVHAKKVSMQVLLQSSCNCLHHDGNASRLTSLAELQGKELLFQSSFVASGIF